MITIFTQIVRPAGRPKNQATITAGRVCGLAEWIIDDSSLYIFWLSFFHPFWSGESKHTKTPNTGIKAEFHVQLRLLKWYDI